MGNEFESKEEEAAWERTAVPQLRDVLKREYDEAQIERDLERERRNLSVLTICTFLHCP